MRRRALVFAMLAATLVAACVGCSGAPKVYVAEPEYDFGVAIEGDKVEHAFLIENQGDAPLVISDVRASCGCTATNLSTSTVDPGKSVRLGVTLSTEGYGGSRVSKAVHITTNDPENGEVVVSLVGTVVNAQAYFVKGEEVGRSLALVIDVRPLANYEQGHLVGAVNLQPGEIDSWLPHIPTGIPVILYDETGEEASYIADAMLRAGYLNVSVLLGGFSEWRRQYGDRLVVTFATVFISLE
ncbi:MAG: DUF1573 domain-containing protein [Candidatus Bipolaricaulota bacterium]|nr:DUF1573 domain-containing protein [Candidatus Bipolaricaulota bacterium]